jgi:hypothetical protein
LLFRILLIRLIFRLTILNLKRHFLIHVNITTRPTSNIYHNLQT